MSFITASSLTPPSISLWLMVLPSALSPHKHQVPHCTALTAAHLHVQAHKAVLAAELLYRDVSSAVDLSTARTLRLNWADPPLAPARNVLWLDIKSAPLPTWAGCLKSLLVLRMDCVTLKVWVKYGLCLTCPTATALPYSSLHVHVHVHAFKFMLHWVACQLKHQLAVHSIQYN
jgi:hypothetical protein